METRKGIMVSKLNAIITTSMVTFFQYECTMKKFEVQEKHELLLKD